METSATFEMSPYYVLRCVGRNTLIGWELTSTKLFNRWCDVVVDGFNMKYNEPSSHYSELVDSLSLDWNEISYVQKSIKLAQYVIAKVKATTPGYTFLAKDNEFLFFDNCISFTILS